LSEGKSAVGTGWWFMQQILWHDHTLISGFCFMPEARVLSGLGWISCDEFLSHFFYLKKLLIMEFALQSAKCDKCENCRRTSVMFAEHSIAEQPHNCFQTILIVFSFWAFLSILLFSCVK